MCFNSFAEALSSPIDIVSVVSFADSPVRIVALYELDIFVIVRVF